MNVVRFSAVEQFGLPIYAPLERLGEINALRLVTDYSIEPQPISTEPIDITPPYFPDAPVRYWVTRSAPEGPVTVHFLPRKKGEMIDIDIGPEGLGSPEVTNTRTIEIPTENTLYGYIANGPRFSELCLHELIVDLDSVR